MGTEADMAPTRSTVLLEPVDVPKASDVLARELRERIGLVGQWRLRRPRM